MTTISLPNTDTGYRVAPDGRIASESGASAYRIESDRILSGTTETGYFVAGETIYRTPKLDTGFCVLGGIIWGPSRELPFMNEQRPLAETRKIDPPPAHASAV